MSLDLPEIDLSTLEQSARKTLNTNWTGAFTKPAYSLYPHQWSWDAAFISIGYSYYDMDRAKQELRHLFRGQWDNGMVPHIVFSDMEEGKDYFPKPGFWKTGNAPHASQNPKTSGMCQPPVHATALRYLIDNAETDAEIRQFAAELFPKLKAWHRFLYRERDPYDEGLVYLRHPWESGQDNSPIWDRPLNAIEINPEELPDYKRHDTSLVDSEERPTKAMYDRYVYLVDFSRKRHYNEQQIWEEGCPFAIQDVLFNTLLCQANRDLATVADMLGKDPRPMKKWAEQTREAMNEKLWDEEHGMYIDYDLRKEEGIHAHALAGFVPYFANIPDRERAERMFDYLNTHCFCRLDEICLAAPSYDRSGSGYSSRKYWRGPIWINMNWLLSKGLERYGYGKYCERIRSSIIELTHKSGFREYYDPDTGNGHGAETFSWSASLTIDTLSTLA